MATSSKTIVKKTTAKISKKAAEKQQFKTSIYTTLLFEDAIGKEGFDKKAKVIRGRARRSLTKSFNAIFLLPNGVRRTGKEMKAFIASKECKAIVNTFIKEYKKNYILNDFSIQSIYEGKEELKIKELTQLLDFIKEQYTATKKPTTRKVTKKATSTTKA